MLDVVGNPNCWFSHANALISFTRSQMNSFYSDNLNNKLPQCTLMSILKLLGSK